MPTPLLYALPGNEIFAGRLSAALNAETGAVALREFPDGESYVRVDTNPSGRDVIIVATLRHPNERILPVVFLADAVREQGAAHVGLVAPYLSYMRQDASFQPGEAITSRSFARLLSRSVDWLLTVDPHLHRFGTLGELYTIPCAAMHAAREIGQWIGANVRSPFIIGPDAESRQWVDGIAAAANAPATVMSNVRRSDHEPNESLPELAGHEACTPVMVDDIISTGQTMTAAIRRLRERGAPPPVCVGVHAVFATGAYSALQSAGARRIVTTNTIGHPSNCIDVVPAVADALRTEFSLGH